MSNFTAKRYFLIFNLILDVRTDLQSARAEYKHFQCAFSD